MMMMRTKREWFPQKFHICSLFLIVSSLRNKTATREDRTEHGKDTGNVTGAIGKQLRIENSLRSTSHSVL